MKNWSLLFTISTCSFCLAECLNLELGNTIDLLKSFGFLNRIYDGDSNQNSTQNLEILYNIFNKSQTQNQTIIYSDEIHLPGSWHVELCDNLSHLLSTVFRNYKIELVENIQKAFIANWSHKNLASFLGLTDTYLTNKYIYLLVKYEQYSKLGKLRDGQFQNVELEDKLNTQIEELKVDDERGTLKFISHYGSHYVSSYTYGDAIFQIFVYDNTTGEYFKKKKDNEKQFHFELEKYAFLFAHSVGEIKTLSGDRYLESLLKAELKDNSAFNYGALKPKRNIIYHMYNNSQILFKEKYRLNRIPLQLKLLTISHVIKDKQKAIWVKEFIDNQIKLRELYL